MPVLDNTKIFCLNYLGQEKPVRPGQSMQGFTPHAVETITLERWPKTKQLHLKKITIKKHLDQLVRAGLCRRVQHFYCLTPAGRKILDQAITPDGYTRPGRLLFRIAKNC